VIEYEYLHKFNKHFTKVVKRNKKQYKKDWKKALRINEKWLNQPCLRGMDNAISDEA